MKSTHNKSTQSLIEMFKKLIGEDKKRSVGAKKIMSFDEMKEITLKNFQKEDIHIGI